MYWGGMVVDCATGKQTIPKLTNLVEEKFQLLYHTGGFRATKPKKLTCSTRIPNQCLFFPRYIFGQPVPFLEKVEELKTHKSQKLKRESAV